MRVMKPLIASITSVLPTTVFDKILHTPHLTWC